MFEQYVLPVTKPRYPNFDVLEDLYWGDLGVRFRWDLSSMFGLEKAKAMGATGHVETTDPAAALFELISILSKDGTEPDPETLPETHDQVVLKAAREAPVDLIRAVVAPERCRFEPDLRTVAETKDMKVDDRQAAEQKGQVRRPSADRRRCRRATARVPRKVEDVEDRESRPRRHRSGHRGRVKHV